MRRIDAVAKADGARRVTGVSVWIGALCHMSAGHFAEHFEQASDGTIANGARLDVIVSDDMHDMNAQDIVLRHVEVEN
jgi:Zn finger protein HypA/HybF involved in hydrogenase expression